MIKTAFSKPLWDPDVDGGPETEAEMSEKSYLNRLGEAHEIAGGAFPSRLSSRFSSRFLLSFPRAFAHALVLLLALGGSSGGIPAERRCGVRDGRVDRCERWRRRRTPLMDLGGLLMERSPLTDLRARAPDGSKRSE